MKLLNPSFLYAKFYPLCNLAKDCLISGQRFSYNLIGLFNFDLVTQLCFRGKKKPKYLGKEKKKIQKVFKEHGGLFFRLKKDLKI